VGFSIAAPAISAIHVVPLYRRINARYLVQACNDTGCIDSNTVTAMRALLEVYVYVRVGSAWAQQAYIKASNTGAEDSFGVALDLSNDGSLLAVGASGEDSGAVGIDGNQINNVSIDAGAVYVYQRLAGSLWEQQTYVKASNTGAVDGFGTSVTLSGNGLVLTVGALNEDSNATGVNGDQTDNSASAAGAVHVYGRSGSLWTQQAYIKGANTEEADRFGCAIALSNDGATLAVGAFGESSRPSCISRINRCRSCNSTSACSRLRSCAELWAARIRVRAPRAWSAAARQHKRMRVCLCDAGRAIRLTPVGVLDESTQLLGSR
jgi:trimeric autotransporter adhesin